MEFASHRDATTPLPVTAKSDTLPTATSPCALPAINHKWSVHIPVTLRQAGERNMVVGCRPSRRNTPHHLDYADFHSPATSASPVTRNAVSVTGSNTADQ